jgi:hypothetical protein
LAELGFGGSFAVWVAFGVLIVVGFFVVEMLVQLEKVYRADDNFCFSAEPVSPHPTAALTERRMLGLFILCQQPIHLCLDQISLSPDSPPPLPHVPQRRGQTMRPDEIPRIELILRDLIFRVNRIRVDHEHLADVGHLEESFTVERLLGFDDAGKVDEFGSVVGATVIEDCSASVCGVLASFSRAKGLNVGIVTDL